MCFKRILQIALTVLITTLPQSSFAEETVNIGEDKIYLQPFDAAYEFGVANAKEIRAPGKKSVDFLTSSKEYNEILNSVYGVNNTKFAYCTDLFDEQIESGEIKYTEFETFIAFADKFEKLVKKDGISSHEFFFTLLQYYIADGAELTPSNIDKFKSYKPIIEGRYTASVAIPQWLFINAPCGSDDLGEHFTEFNTQLEIFKNYIKEIGIF